MHSSFCENAQITANGHIEGPQLLRDPSVTFDRIRALASLAQTLDPSLGKSLRFVQRGTSDSEDRKNIPFQIFFSHDNRAKLPFAVLEDPEPVGFWDALEKVLPAAAFADEVSRFSIQPKLRFSSAEDAAIRTAFLEMKISFQHRLVNDDTLVVTSGPVQPNANEFMLYPDLTRIATLAPLSEADKANPNPDSGILMRKDVQTLKTLLAKPFAEATASERMTVVKTIDRLNNRAGHRRYAQPSFEVQQKHGWIGYALSKKAEGWTGFLLARGHCSPHAFFGSVSPLALAIANNDRASAVALLESGAGSNVSFQGWPKMYDGRSQDALESQPATFVSPLMLASRVGATPVAGALLQHGADPNLESDFGVTPLLVASMSGNESMVRVLLQHGADPSHQDSMGRFPSEVVPDVPSADALFDVLENARLNLKHKTLDKPAVKSPVVSSEDHPIASVWADPPRRRPRP